MKSSGLYHLKVYSSLKSAHHLKTRSLPLGLFTTSSLLTTSRSARHLKTCSPPQCLKVLITTSRSAQPQRGDQPGDQRGDQFVERGGSKVQRGDQRGDQVLTWWANKVQRGDQRGDQVLTWWANKVKVVSTWWALIRVRKFRQSGFQVCRQNRVQKWAVHQNPRETLKSIFHSDLWCMIGLRPADSSFKIWQWAVSSEK